MEKNANKNGEKNTGNFPPVVFPPVLPSPPDQRPRCSVKVYAIDLASSQRSYLEKLAKETSLLSYGYDPTSLGKHWK